MKKKAQHELLKTKIKIRSEQRNTIHSGTVICVSQGQRHQSKWGPVAHTVTGSQSGAVCEEEKPID